MQVVLINHGITTIWAHDSLENGTFYLQIAFFLGGPVNVIIVISVIINHSFVTDDSVTPSKQKQLSRISPTLPVLRMRHSNMPQKAHWSNRTLDLESPYPTSVPSTGQGRILYIPNLWDQAFRYLGFLLSPLSRSPGAILQPLLSAVADVGWCGPQALYWAYMPADCDRPQAGLRKR